METAIERFLVPSALSLFFAALLLGVRSVVFRYLHLWAVRTDTRFDDILVAALKGPTIFWALALGIYLGVLFSGLEGRSVSYINKIIYILLILSATFSASGLAGRFFKRYVRQADLPLGTTGLASALLKGTIILMGFLAILAVLGISIAPLVTALGVGGLAVALALQDTLANLFSGIHILMEKSIRIGDFIRLESGQEGYVDDITWRTTRVRMLPNNIVVIPNSKLAQSVVTNYYLPEKRMSLLIAVNVSYSSDPEQVEHILIDEAKKAVGRVPGLLGDPAPFVRFIPGFGDSSLDFTLICQVGEFVDQYLAQHELRKNIFRRFREEGIEIPFPQRTVHLRQENGRTP